MVAWGCGGTGGAVARGGGAKAGRGPFRTACSTSYYYYYSFPTLTAFLGALPYPKTHQNLRAHHESRKISYSIGLQHGRTKLAL